MKHDSWKVGKGVRSQRPGECFYCGAKVGAEHNWDCVCRLRTVVVRATVDLVREVPEDWTKEDIESQLNESSWCASNILDDFTRIVAARDSCICEASSFEYLREASEKDEIELGERTIVEAALDEANAKK